MLTIGALCAGIGGLELGLEWAGLGPTVFQVEIDPFCRRMLKKNFPHAKIFEDIKKCGAHNLPRVGLLCFGFPCQDVSSAGEKAGLTGARSGLFYECARIASELRPEWIVVENVASGAHLWVDTCCAELERLGYACLPIPIAARDVGALHRRSRVFIVAHSNGGFKHAEPGFAEVASASEASGTSPGAADALGKGQRGQVSRAGFDREGRRQVDAASRAGTAADPDNLGRKASADGISGEQSRGQPVAQSDDRRSAGFPGWGPEPDLVRVVHGVSAELDSTGSGARRPAAIRAANDLAAARESALGNSVVPQCAEVIGWVIRELIAEMENEKCLP